MGDAPDLGIDLAGLYVRAGDVLERESAGLARQLARRHEEEVGSYSPRGLDVVAANIEATLLIAARMLARGTSMDDRAVAELTTLVRAWAESGAALDAIVHANQVSAHELVRWARGFPGDLDLDREQERALQDAMLLFVLRVTKILTDVQRDRAVAAARLDAERRGDVLRDLVAGRLAPERLAQEAALLGLDPALRYVPICAWTGAGVHVADLERHLRAAGSTATHRAVQALVEGELVALAPQRPSALPGATIAVGPPVLLHEARDGFAEARHLLLTARRYGRTGVVDLEGLGPLALVLLGDRFAERLQARIFADPGPGFEDAEETARMFLEHDLHIENTAAAMFLHPNTVRYRLRRFRETTGLNERRVEDLVLAWWLLRWRQPRGD